MNKPIRPGMHGAIDYGFLALNLAAPTLLGLRGAARGLSYLFGGIQGGLNAGTDRPLALARLVPFRTPGTMELSSGPLFVALPWLTGAFEEPRARNYFWPSPPPLRSTALPTGARTPMSRRRDAESPLRKENGTLEERRKV